MKKMMIIAMLALVATFAQASQVSWKFNAGTSYGGYLVYLVTSIPTDGFTESGANAISTKLLGTSGNTGTLTAGRTSASASGTIGGLSATDGSTVNFYYVIVNPNDATGYWTVSSSAEAYTTATTHTDSSIATSAGTTLLSSAKTPWATGGGGGGDVPEPTSGLLFLVGGALLALRRKQK